MAAILLLPGYGGRYTSETFGSTSTAGADTLDCSRCNSLGIQIDVTAAATGTIDIEHTFNGSDWAALASSVGLSTDGSITMLDPNDGPFGLCRINPTAILTGSVGVSIVGFVTPVVW